MVGLVFVLGPIENYERLPLSCRQPIKLDIKAVKPWLRYSFDRLWGTSADGERFAYYVERGEPTVMQFEHLETSFLQAAFRRSTSIAPKASFASASVTAFPFPAATMALSASLFPQPFQAFQHRFSAAQERMGHSGQRERVRRRHPLVQ